MHFLLSPLVMYLFARQYGYVASLYLPAEAFKTARL